MKTLKEQYLDTEGRLVMLREERERLMLLQNSDAAEFDSSRLRQVFREITTSQAAKFKLIQCLPAEDLQELFPTLEPAQPTTIPPSFQRWFFNTLNSEAEAAQADRESGRDKLSLWHGWQFKSVIIFMMLAFVASVAGILFKQL